MPIIIGPLKQIFDYCKCLRINPSTFNYSYIFAINCEVYSTTPTNFRIINYFTFINRTIIFFFEIDKLLHSSITI